MQIKHILILCTGNSCRSQMAEGWGNHLSKGKIKFRSAGIEAHGKNPRAILAMKEAGVDISGQESNKVTDDMIDWSDLVITVCGHADEVCPSLPPQVMKRHVPFDDPAKAGGTEEEILGDFRRVRNEIEAYVSDLLVELD